jgi:hypothetical protein
MRRATGPGATALPAIALAALLALPIGGCGGGGPHEPSSEEQAAIEARFSEYIEAYGKGDAVAVCATVSPDIVEEMGGEEACEKAYEPTLGKGGEELAKALEESGYDRIEVADDGSIARMYFPESTVPLRFEPVDDDWYVVPPDSISGA